jgi:hypothetical protein
VSLLHGLVPRRLGPPSCRGALRLGAAALCLGTTALSRQCATPCGLLGRKGCLARLTEAAHGKPVGHGRHSDAGGYAKLQMSLSLPRCRTGVRTAHDEDPHRADQQGRDGQSAQPPSPRLRSATGRDGYRGRADLRWKVSCLETSDHSGVRLRGWSERRNRPHRRLSTPHAFRHARRWRVRHIDRLVQGSSALPPKVVRVQCV